MDLEANQAGSRTVFGNQDTGECINLSNPFIIITRGLPGSGKSTWADGTAILLKNTVKVERDEMRKLHFKQYGKLSREQEEQVTRTQEALVRTYIGAGVNVIVSDTNLPDRSVKRWQKIALELGVDALVQEFRDVPLEKVLENNAARNRYTKIVPEEVIRDMHNRFIKGRDLTKEVIYTPPLELEVIPYEQPDWGTGYTEAVIYDIDGTLAVLGDRSPYDPTKYHLDTLNVDVHESLLAHWKAGREIIIVSGRDDAYRHETITWLNDVGVQWDKLYMRPTENRADGKKTEDSIIKYELFNKHIRDEKYRILGVYDDRHRVLRMWRKLGLTTFHVNGPDAGNF
jgi:predicted kinase